MTEKTFKGKSIRLNYHLNWDNNDVGIIIGDKKTRKRVIVAGWFFQVYLLWLRIVDMFWRINHE